MVAWPTWVQSCNTQAGSGLGSNSLHWHFGEHQTGAKCLMSIWEVKWTSQDEQGTGQEADLPIPCQARTGVNTPGCSWAKGWRPDEAAQSNSNLLMHLGSGQKTQPVEGTQFTFFRKKYLKGEMITCLQQPKQDLGRGKETNELLYVHCTIRSSGLKLK